MNVLQIMLMVGFLHAWLSQVLRPWLHMLLHCGPVLPQRVWSGLGLCSCLMLRVPVVLLLLAFTKQRVCCMLLAHQVYTLENLGSGGGWRCVVALLESQLCTSQMQKLHHLQAGQLHKHVCMLLVTAFLRLHHVLALDMLFILLQVMERLRQLGVLIGKGGLYGNVFRIKPPMCLSIADADFLLQAFDQALSEL